MSVLRNMSDIALQGLREETEFRVEHVKMDPRDARRQFRLLNEIMREQGRRAGATDTEVEAWLKR